MKRKRPARTSVEPFDPSSDPLSNPTSSESLLLSFGSMVPESPKATLRLRSGDLRLWDPFIAIYSVNGVFSNLYDLNGGFSTSYTQSQWRNAAFSILQ